MKKVGSVSIWPGSQRGVAMVLTLLILTLLVASSLELNRAMRVEANLAGNFRDLTQASYIAQSGVEIARALIQQDEPSYDALDERWAQFEILAVFSSQLFNEGHFTGQITDEGAKFNPNGLIDSYGIENLKKKNQLERLLAILGHDPQKMDAVLDWLDPDDHKRPLGAEREYYMNLKRPYAPKNGPLDSWGEFLLIKEVDLATFFGTDEREGLGKYLTIYSDGKININTASIPVLMSLSPRVDQPMAQAVLDYRTKKPFRQNEDLRSVPGWGQIYAEISSEITVRSNFFSIGVLGYYRDALAAVQTVVKREGRKTRVLFWKAG
ncbi:MAG: type II secretion system minor pseudopilin GspK [Deltaproteobacteria bacterium]|nr:type II secretion system minor pseudopilin GspK [Deltaproteobacteria bacterium]